MHTVRAMRCALGSCVVATLIAVTTACAGSTVEDRPYDAKLDAGAAIEAALADNPDQRRVLLTFGANWCSDSRSLARHYQSPELAELLGREFRTVHVDIGMHHRNQQLVQKYGNPTDKGIPSVVLLDPAGTPLYVDHGSLSSAETMSAPAILEFFQRLARDGRID